MTTHWFDPLMSGDFSAELDYEFWPAVNENSRKLLVVLHGRGDSREGFHWLPEALAIDDFHFLFLNAPEAYGSGFSWYALPPRQGPGICRSRALLERLFTNLHDKLNLRYTDLFLFGFSQGCLMSLDVTLRSAHALGGVVGVSGYVYFLDEYPAAFGPAVTVQHILVTHGYRDDLLPLAETRASIEVLRGHGVHIDWREFDKAHTIDEVQELPELRAFLNRLLELC